MDIYKVDVKFLMIIALFILFTTIGRAQISATSRIDLQNILTTKCISNEDLFSQKRLDEALFNGFSSIDGLSVDTDDGVTCTDLINLSGFPKTQLEAEFGIQNTFYIVDTNDPLAVINDLDPIGFHDLLPFTLLVEVQSLDELLAVIAHKDVTFVEEDAPIVQTRSSVDLIIDPDSCALIEEYKPDRPHPNDISDKDGPIIVIVDNGANEGESLASSPILADQYFCFSSNRKFTRGSNRSTTEFTSLCEIQIDECEEKSSSYSQCFSESNFREEAFSCGSSDCKHGQNMIDIIGALSPDSPLISIQVFSDAASSRKDIAFRSDILRAFKYINGDLNPQLVNVSLGAEREDQSQTFEYSKNCSKGPLNGRGFSIFAGGNVSEKVTWPGCQAVAITVDQEIDHPLIDFAVNSCGGLSSQSTALTTGIVALNLLEGGGCQNPRECQELAYIFMENVADDVGILREE